MHSEKKKSLTKIEDTSILHTIKMEFLKMKHANVTRSASVKRKAGGAKHSHRPHQILLHQKRLGMRRGSSMSDLEKFSTQQQLPDIVRSTTATNQLSVSSVGSLTLSPNLSRSYLSSQTASVRGQYFVVVIVWLKVL